MKIPYDQTYCSSQLTNGSFVIAQSNACHAVIDIAQMIYPVNGHEYTFKLTSLPTKGKLHVDNVELNTITDYAYKTISYKATTGYGMDAFEYVAMSNGKQSRTCQYQINVCHPVCQNCLPKSNDEKNISCYPGYAPLLNKTNCLNIDEDYEHVYYDEIDDIFKDCDESCKICYSKPDKCSKCETGYYFKNDNSLNCHQKHTFLANNPAYYLSRENPPIYRQCYHSCASCDGRGTTLAHNCNSCVNGYSPHPKDFSMCCKYWIRARYGENLCTDECKGDYPFLEPKLMQCLAVCPYQKPFSLNDTCFSKCPADTISYENICYKKHCFPNPSNYFIDGFFPECFQEIEANILTLKKMYHMINGKDFSLEVYLNNNQKTVNLSSIDISTCKETLINKNIIAKNEDLIIAKYDIIKKKEDTYNRVEYQIFNHLGEKLNLSECSRSIDISYPIKSPELMSKEIMYYYYRIGIDFSDAKSSFFNNICHYTAIPSLTYSLQYKRWYLFRKQSFCEPICEYQYTDYYRERVDCLCDVKPKITFDEEKDLSNNYHHYYKYQYPFLKDIPLIPFVGHCYHLILHSSFVKSSFGFWFIGILFLINVLFMLIFSFEGTKKLYHSLNEREKKYNALQSEQAINRSDQDMQSSLEKNNSTNIIDINCADNNIIPPNEYPEASSVIESTYALISKTIRNNLLLPNLFSSLLSFNIRSIYISHIILTIELLLTLCAIFCTEDLHHGMWFDLTVILSFFLCIIIGIVLHYMQRLLNLTKLSKELLDDNMMSINQITDCKAQFRKSIIRIRLYYVMNIIMSLMCLYYCTIYCLLFQNYILIWLYFGGIHIGLLTIAKIAFCIFVVGFKKHCSRKQTKKKNQVNLDL